MTRGPREQRRDRTLLGLAARGKPWALPFLVSLQPLLVAVACLRPRPEPSLKFEEGVIIGCLRWYWRATFVRRPGFIVIKATTARAGSDATRLCSA